MTHAVVAEQAVGGTSAEVHAPDDHGPYLLGLNAEGWVYVGVSIFIVVAIVWLKAHKTLTAGLDARIAATRRSLDDAEAIRKDAEALLAEAKRQQQASAGDAAAILEQARTEAAQLIAKAEDDSRNLVARREQMAKDKIGAAERSAVSDLRARAAAAAAMAAQELIADQHDAAADKPMIDNAIKALN